MTTFAVGDVLTTRKQFDALPNLTVALGQAMSPTAFQKRAASIPEIEPETFFASDGNEWGLTSGDLLEEGIQLQILWLPETPAGTAG